MNDYDELRRKTYPMKSGVQSCCKWRNHWNGLCIDNCPHQAIKGKGEHRVSTSKVFESVWIDPELC